MSCFIYDSIPSSCRSGCPGDEAPWVIREGLEGRRLSQRPALLATGGDERGADMMIFSRVIPRNDVIPQDFFEYFLSGGDHVFRWSKED